MSEVPVLEKILTNLSDSSDGPVQKADPGELPDGLDEPIPKAELINLSGKTGTWKFNALVVHNEFLFSTAGRYANCVDNDTQNSSSSRAASHPFTQHSRSELPDLTNLVHLAKN
ncbi:hypothetical protein N7507_009236 [Penicillium longicatenatum]|nr:hypothetical protein N7507_009236 [Penicillium longicatenatum]